MDFSGGLVVKSVPAKQEMCIQSRGQEDLLEKEMATHSIILAWEIHEQRSLAGKVHGITRVGHDLVTDQPTNTHTHTHSLTAFPWWTPWAPPYQPGPVPIITHPWPSHPWHVL